jgi:hypothetical protein
MYEAIAMSLWEFFAGLFAGWFGEKIRKRDWALFDAIAYLATHAHMRCLAEGELYFRLRAVFKGAIERGEIKGKDAVRIEDFFHAWNTRLLRRFDELGPPKFKNGRLLPS